MKNRINREIGSEFSYEFIKNSLNNNLFSFKNMDEIFTFSGRTAIETILNNLENIIGGDLEKIPDKIKEEYILKLKLIPFSSLGKQNGMLIGIKPEYVKIITEEQEEIKENVIIGIYNKSLTKKGEYRALMGIELL